MRSSSLRGGAAPVIFDDPVNSLDHRRIREIAARIVALSKSVQVVVFSHDIWFVSELLAECDSSPAGCAYYEVCSRDGRKGVISHGTHPQLDTPNQLKGRINQAIQVASSTHDDQDQDRIGSIYDHVRAWCELVVEVDLLAKVTQRHQPNVAIQNLERIRADRFQAAVDVIMPVWERANRYVRAHSQPLDTLGVRPTLDELRDDWDRLQKARNAYLAPA